MNEPLVDFQVPGHVREELLAWPAREEAPRDVAALRGRGGNPACLEFVRAQECLGCFLRNRLQTSPTEAHHIEIRGLALKCPDEWTIPLCHDCHVDGVHRGRHAFVERFASRLPGRLPGDPERFYQEAAALYLALFLQARFQKMGRLLNGKHDPDRAFRDPLFLRGTYYFRVLTALLGEADL